MELLFPLIVSSLLALWIANRYCRHWFFGFLMACFASILFMFGCATISDVTSESPTLRGLFLEVAGVLFSPVAGLLAVLVLLRKARHQKAGMARES